MLNTLWSAIIAEGDNIRSVEETRVVKLGRWKKFEARLYDKTRVDNKVRVEAEEVIAVELVSAIS